MVQAVNGTGLVSLNTNLGEYFRPNIDPARPPITGAQTSLVMQVAWDTDYYGSFVPVKAYLSSNSQGVSDQTVYFSLGSQRRAAKTDSNGIAFVKFPLLSQPGEYKIRAAFGGPKDFKL